MSQSIVGNSMNATQASAPPQPPQMRLNGPANHLEEMTKGLTEYANRLDAVADRLFGAIPQTAGSGQTQRVHSAGVVGRYEEIADTYAALLRRVGDSLERLERL